MVKFFKNVESLAICEQHEPIKTAFKKKLTANWMCLQPCRSEIFLPVCYRKHNGTMTTIAWYGCQISSCTLQTDWQYLVIQ